MWRLIKAPSWRENGVWKGPGCRMTMPVINTPLLMAFRDASAPMHILSLHYVPAARTLRLQASRSPIPPLNCPHAIIIATILCLNGTASRTSLKRQCTSSASPTNPSSTPSTGRHPFIPGPSKTDGLTLRWMTARFMLATLASAGPPLPHRSSLDFLEPFPLNHDLDPKQQVRYHDGWSILRIECCCRTLSHPTLSKADDRKANLEETEQPRKE
ncbi:hypothetical protein CC78DRAFT_578982 [Lojkania enalia]|uniref:Uncharacterized protein n=1 Tax=Lojkania enalia TaxID=147567 RepID=A0A9P4KG45_9PLEO|nr:hypothetical protein CC78DRAFT_578982 [Didymosphaeria enalia]